MALPISPISTQDVRGVLGVTGTSSFGDLCNNIGVNEAGLNSTYCPDLGAGKLANLRSTPYVLGKFRGYDHSVVPVIDIHKLLDPPTWLSGGTWTYNQWANSFDPINNGVDVSFGFDSSFGGYYYDASITAIPSWITVKNIAGDALSVGSTVRPFGGYSGDGGMKVWPNSANGGSSDRSGQVIISNNYSGTASWTVYQAAYIPPPSINDWLESDVSVIYTSPYPMASFQGTSPDYYIRMLGGFKYVLTLTNVSTNTVTFGSDCSVAVVSRSQYNILDEGYEYPGPWIVQVINSGSTPAMPASLGPSSSWSSGVLDARGGGTWDSTTGYDADSLWNVNEWWPRVYFSGYVGQSYDNVVVHWGNSNPALIHDPSLIYSPHSKNFGWEGGSQIVDIDYDAYWWDGPWTISESLSWISITGGSGTGPGSFTINCDQQSSGGAARNGTITINSFSTPGSPSYTIAVSQDASLNPGPFNISMDIQYIGDMSFDSGLIGPIYLRTYPGNTIVSTINLVGYYKGGNQVFSGVTGGQTYYVDFSAVYYWLNVFSTSGTSYWRYAGDLYWNYQNYTDPFTLTQSIALEFETPH